MNTVYRVVPSPKGFMVRVQRLRDERVVLGKFFGSVSWACRSDGMPRYFATEQDAQRYVQRCEHLARIRPVRT